MSAQTVETVLIRLASDEAFAKLLLANPEQALSSYDLSTEEKATLKGLQQADFDRYASASLEERKSMSIAWNHNELIFRAV